MADANRLPSWPLPAAAAALLIFAYALILALGTFDPVDLFIYRLGAELTAKGQTPYDIPTIRREVAARFPGSPTDPDNVADNCGYFLSPMAALAYMPLAAVPWPVAKVCWAILIGIAAFAMACLPWLLRPPGQPIATLATLLVPFLLVINPPALMVVVAGQTAILLTGCVAAGLWAFDRGRPYLGAMLWVLPFIKPHLALPLIPLAWYLGGWRPAVLLVVLVGLLNLAGAWAIGGSPLYLKEYLDFLPNARTAVRFNRAELNPAVTSWNRLLFAAGGPLIELSAATVVAGYLVWYGLIGARIAGAGEKPSAAWAAAATAVGAVMCSQVLPYELLLLAAVVPWVRDLFANGYWFRGWLAVLFMAVHLIPQMVMERYGIRAHHPLAVALLALLVLTGPIRLPRSPSGRG